MYKPILWTVTFCVMTGLGTTAESRELRDKWDHFWYNVHRDFDRNNSWPYPFQQNARAATRLPIETMVHNGWRMQNLISDEYFDEESNELTRAGERKIRAILANSPAQHRTIYVQRNLNAETTSIRVDAVQKTASRFVIRGELPEVVRTHISPRRWTAEQVHQSQQAYWKNRPDPVLPEAKGLSEN